MNFKTLQDVKSEILERLGSLFLSPKNNDILISFQRSIENILIPDQKEKLLLRAQNMILSSKNYSEFLKGLESSCHILDIEALYFDFPQETIGSDFHDLRIHSFLKHLYDAQKNSDKLILNQELILRKNKKNTYFHHVPVQLNKGTFSFNSVNELTKKGIDFDPSKMEYTEGENGKITIDIVHTIGYIASSVNVNSIFYDKTLLSQFLETIQDKILDLGNIAMLQEHAYNDKLTGLYNKRYLDEIIKDYKTLKIPLAFFSLDCNGFKAINDTYGHDAGDLVLEAVGKELQDVAHNYFNSQHSAIVARPGGDEFQSIFPNCDIEKANSLCKLIIEKIEAISIPYETSSSKDINNTVFLKIGTCIGVKIWNGEQDENFAKRSDELLYNRKEVKNISTEPKFIIE